MGGEEGEDPAVGIAGAHVVEEVLGVPVDPLVGVGDDELIVVVDEFLCEQEPQAGGPG